MSEIRISLRKNKAPAIKSGFFAGDRFTIAPFNVQRPMVFALKVEYSAGQTSK
jgi:hypothetical protein